MSSTGHQARVLPAVSTSNSILYNHFVFGLRRRQGAFDPLLRWLQSLAKHCVLLVELLRDVEEHDLVLRILLGGLVSLDHRVATAAAEVIASFCRAVDSALPQKQAELHDIAPDQNQHEDEDEDREQLQQPAATHRVPNLPPKAQRAALASANRKRRQQQQELLDEQDDNAHDDEQPLVNIHLLDMPSCRQRRWWLFVGGRWRYLRDSATNGDVQSPLHDDKTRTWSFKEHARRHAAVTWLAESDGPFGLAAVVSLLCSWSGIIPRETVTELVCGFVEHPAQMLAVLDRHVPDLIGNGLSAKFRDVDEALESMYKLPSGETDICKQLTSQLLLLRPLAPVIGQKSHELLTQLATRAFEVLLPSQEEDSDPDVFGDLNGDGHPEVVFNNYYSGSWSTLPDSYIYWGSAGAYSESNRTDLETYGSWPVVQLVGTTDW